MMKRSAAAGLTLALAVLAFVAGRYSGGRSPTGSEPARSVLYYVDPMHPSYRSDRPGVAPDCGMQLEPVYADAEPGKGPAAATGTVFISSEKQGLIGVRVETVRKDSGPRMVRTTGRVEVDGDRLFRLMAGAEGWVESVQNNPVGTVVRKDDLLATLYSREFRNAQQAYLGSLVSVDRLKSGHNEDDPNRGGNTNLRNNEEQLRALGMGEAQIQQLRRTRQITSEISVTAPVDGVVLSRDISPGQRFETGTQFYRIADLRKVWITADVNGEDAPMYRPGARVRVVVRERDVTVSATVGKAPPFFDPESRTLRLRLEADNPGFVLRPDMFVEVELPAHGVQALTISVDALLDSGLSQRVFVERAPGEFEPRTVEIGRRLGDRVEILKGLQEGERVVASGTFLVDSESRLRTSAR